MQLSLENTIALPFFRKMEIALAFLESATFELVYIKSTHSFADVEC
jgi:hypothetical protein